MKVTIETANGAQEFELKDEDFSIDETSIDVELCRMGRLMIDYGHLEAALGLEVERKEATLTQLDAELDAKIRVAAKNSGAKVTESGITAEIRRTKERIFLVETLQNSRRNHNILKWAMRALQGKKDCLIALAYRDRALIKSGAYND